MKKLRWPYLAVLLIAVLLSVKAKFADQTEVVEPVNAHATSIVTSAQSTQRPAREHAASEHIQFLPLVHFEEPASQTANAKVIPVFSVHDWTPPPPPAMPPPPPPPPMAPPLPYQYLGKLQESGEGLKVFLSNGDASLTIKEGQTIEGTYKVEKITTSEVVFTYLPLHQQQTLPIGAN